MEVKKLHQIEAEKPFLKFYNTFSKKMYPYVPFTYYWYLVNAVGSEGNTLIDFGCGWGDPVEVLQKRKRRYAVGVDVFKTYLEVVKNKKIYNKLILKDIRKYSGSKKYDIVLCSHVLEHLPEPESKKLLRFFERIAKQKIVITLPVGSLPQGEYDHNKYQQHISSWNPQDFKKDGYKVLGFTPKFLFGKENMIQKFSFLGFFLFIVSYLLEPIFVNFPDKCVYFMAVKDINNG